MASRRRACQRLGIRVIIKPDGKSGFSIRYFFLKEATVNPKPKPKAGKPKNASQISFDETPVPMHVKKSISPTAKRIAPTIRQIIPISLILAFFIGVASCI